MTNQLREERCAQIRDAMIEIFPAIIEGSGTNKARLLDAQAALVKLQQVAALGADGIDHPDYIAWVNQASESLRPIEEALENQDADAAFAALRSPGSGLEQLTRGCSDCQGW